MLRGVLNFGSSSKGFAILPFCKRSNCSETRGPGPRVRFISHLLSPSHAICSPEVSHEAARCRSFDQHLHVDGWYMHLLRHSEINNGARIYAVCARSYRGSTHRSFYRVCSLSGNASFRALIDESRAHPALRTNIYTSFFARSLSAGSTPHCTTSRNDLRQRVFILLRGHPLPNYCEKIIKSSPSASTGDNNTYDYVVYDNLRGISYLDIITHAG